jgi:hypothetical protein
MENMENGILGVFEPRCKIRFLSDPKPDEEYIAVPVSEMIDLIADQMKLIALDSGGVDNWSWYGESLREYLKDLPNEYGDKFWTWVHNEKAVDETAEDFVDDMSFEDFARYEVDVM